MLAAHLHMSSVAYLQKRNIKKWAILLPILISVQWLEKNNSSLAEAKKLLNYGLAVHNNGIKSLVLQYKVVGQDETLLVAVR